MVAVQNGNHECVKELLANGADLNAANTVSVAYAWECAQEETCDCAYALRA